MEKEIKASRTIENLKKGNDIIIGALGDSLTYGWMVSKGYLDFLEEFLMEKYPGSSFTILNRGIPGDTADGGLRRIGSDIIVHDPHCVLVQFALNDLSIGISVEEFGESILGIIERLERETRAEIVLVTSVCLGPVPEKDISEVYYNKLEELSGLKKLPIARVHWHIREEVSRGIKSGSLFQYDQVHPTSEGYRLMAEAVMQVF